MVLVDTYGRILTEYDSDGNFRTAVVWVPGDSRIDWDSASDTELVALLNKYGHNDALTIDEGTKNVIISTNDETETLVWDNTAMDFTVDFDQWQNGTANMFYRTVQVNNQNVTVLCDADGKAIRAPFGQFDTAVFQVGDDGASIESITAGSSIAIADVVTACGGATDIANLDGGDVVELLVNGNYVQFCNTDSTTTTPMVALYGGPVIAAQGKVQIFDSLDCNHYADGQSNVVYARVNINVGVNGGFAVGSPADPGKALAVHAPTTSSPSDPYNVQVWIEFSSADTNNPITAGTVIRAEQPAQYFTPVDNPTVIFE